MHAKTTWLAFALAALLVACGGGGGGGGGNTIQCIASISQGPVPGDVSGPGGAGGVGDGGSGTGAGSVGGVEGQFKRALIEVEQADGKFLAEAQVDDTYGMVRVDLCHFTGAVKFTLKGKADGSTVYYDEGKGTELPFPANETMHVVIPSYSKNVGITPLTEAAYQYIVAKYGANGWKAVANVNEANEAIRTEFNRHLPAALQIEDITRLPAIIGPTTQGNTLPATKNGLYGTVISGLAQSAALFNVGEITPALTIARQIGLDLSDGKLDLFFCSNGDPANCTPAPVLDGRTNPATRSTYSTAQFAEMVNTGISQISARFGNEANKVAALKFTQVKIFSRDAGSGGGYSDLSPIFLLRNDGNIYVWPRRDQPMHLYDTGYRQMYAASSMLGSKRNGSVFKDPTITYPPPNDPNGVPTIAFPPTEVPDYFAATRISGTASTFSSSFNQIVRKQDSNAYVDTRATMTGGLLGPALLPNIVDVAVARGGAGAGSYYAVRSDGRVYAWGWNGTLSTLGLDRSDETIPDPVLSPTLANIVSVAGCMFGGFALDRTGRVWGWGAGAQECASVTSRVPVLVASINAFGPISQLQCGSFWGCIGLARNGDVIVWGIFRDASDPTIGYTTPPIKLALPAGRRGIYVGATSLFVYGLLDDGKIIVFKSRPETPTFLDTSSVPIM
jgi:hypothetical protein